MTCCVSMLYLLYSELLVIIWNLRRSVNEFLIWLDSFGFFLVFKCWSPQPSTLPRCQSAFLFQLPHTEYILNLQTLHLTLVEIMQLAFIWLLFSFLFIASDICVVRGGATFWIDFSFYLIATVRHCQETMPHFYNIPFPLRDNNDVCECDYFQSHFLCSNHHVLIAVLRPDEVNTYCLSCESNGTDVAFGAAVEAKWMHLLHFFFLKALE